MTWNLSCEQFFWSMMQTKLTITNQFKMPACYFWLKNGTRKKFTNANQWNDWNLDAFYFNCIRTSSLEIALYTKYLVCTYVWQYEKVYLIFRKSNHPIDRNYGGSVTLFGKDRKCALARDKKLYLFMLLAPSYYI